MAKIYKKSLADGSINGLLGSVPCVKNYGDIIFIDETKDGKDISSLDLDNSNIMSYIIMPRYGVNL